MTRISHWSLAVAFTCSSHNSVGVTTRTGDGDSLSAAPFSVTRSRLGETVNLKLNPAASECDFAHVTVILKNPYRYEETSATSCWWLFSRVAQQWSPVPRAAGLAGAGSRAASVPRVQLVHFVCLRHRRTPSEAVGAWVDVRPACCLVGHIFFCETRDCRTDDAKTGYIKQSCIDDPEACGN